MMGEHEYSLLYILPLNIIIHQTCKNCLSPSRYKQVPYEKIVKVIFQGEKTQSCKKYTMYHTSTI